MERQNLKKPKLQKHGSLKFYTSLYCNSQMINVTKMKRRKRRRNLDYVGYGVLITIVYGMSRTDSFFFFFFLMSREYFLGVL